VPKFKDIFNQLHADLPLPTKILLFTENIINNYGFFLFVLGFFLFMGHKFWYKTNKEYRYKVDYFILKLKIISDLVMNASMSRFLMVLTELTRAGIPLITALKIANGIIENSVLNDKIDKIISEINQGHSLAEAIQKQDILDNITLQMISAGEKAGNLEDMLENASNYYKNRFQATIDGLSDAIEPLMLALIGGLVLILALGIFLPMWNMASAVKG
jgi:general secretion pathway protein F/MSHA biogenesis protein MshG